MQQVQFPQADQEQQRQMFQSSAPPIIHEQPQQPPQNKDKCHNITIIIIAVTVVIIVIGLFYQVQQNDKVLKSKINEISKKDASGNNVPDQKSEKIRNGQSHQNRTQLFDSEGKQVTTRQQPQKSHFEPPPAMQDKTDKPQQQNNPPTVITKQPQQTIQPNPLLQKFMEKRGQESQKLNVTQILKDLQSNSSDKFGQLPKKIWIFSQKPSQEQLLTQHCLNSTFKIANQSGYTVTLVNRDTFQKMVEPTLYKKFEQTLKALQRQAVNNPLSGYDIIIPLITRDLVMLQVLHRFGGIIMDKDVILTEKLDWLSSISTNPHVNTGNPHFPTKYFGFFNANFSTNQEPFNHSSPHPQYIIKNIGLQSFFLAGVPNQQFIAQVLKMIYYVILNPQNTKETLIKLKLGRAITNQFIVSNAFPICCRLVIKQKEMLDHQGLLPIDYYGIKTMNSLFFPKKVAHHFEHSFDEKIYRNLARYSLRQFEQTVGPLRYMVILPFTDYIETKLNQVFKTTFSSQGSEVELLHPQSFLVKHFFPNIQKSFLETQIDESQTNNNRTSWSQLPKIIWLQHPQAQSVNIVEQLLYRNIVRRAKQSGFQVRTVNLNKLDKWLNKYELGWIKNTAEKAQIKMYNKTKMEIAKLNILIRYGGIWLNRHFFAVESFDWVINITSYPPQLIFNRYGNLPKVVMYFNPHYGQSFHWFYDHQANTKNMFDIGFDSNFIAAQPDSKLLKDWIRTFTKFLTRKYNQNLSDMSRLEVATQRWTVKQNTYFAMLDAVKIVMANKNRQLQLKLVQEENYNGPHTAPEHYEVWSISGTQGPLKLDLSFASPNNQKGDINAKSNSLIWRYPQNYTEAIIGKINKLGRLYHTNTIELIKILKLANKATIASVIDPESIFYRQLLEPVMKDLKMVDEQLAFSE